MNALILYNATQTYTSTVFEHLAAFSRYSQNKIFYAHQESTTQFNINHSNFDVLIIHYSIRLPFDQISPKAADLIKEFKGLKVLFIQDEYDFTYRTWHWINKLSLDLVFTVVPHHNIEKIYPSSEFPDTQFISNLTGYVPENLDFSAGLVPPSQRSLVIGYRGRPLPLRYGQLGFEKVNIGKIVSDYCKSYHIEHDVAWTEESRIYGPKWYDFIKSCKAMLGSESGSNVFDWDGTLSQKISNFKKRSPKATDPTLYEELIRPLEINELMNQISPRVFECIACKTVLVLFEGAYSGIIQPDIHYISLKKDGSNLDEVFTKLNDSHLIDEMADRTYKDIIESGSYSYQKFIKMVDMHIAEAITREVFVSSSNSAPECGIPQTPITTLPIRAKAPLNIRQINFSALIVGLLTKTPIPVRNGLKFLLSNQQLQSLKQKISLYETQHTPLTMKNLLICVWPQVPTPCRRVIIFIITKVGMMQFVKNQWKD